jgi:3-hydroxyisobutyrate dehydrogenase-like beta-hydroxyacid dehydrogenase
VALTVAAAAAAADVVVSSLPNDDVLRGVALGPEGLLAHARAGQVYIDTSTVSPGASGEVAAQAAAHGVHYLRAPVSGSTATAEAAMLTSMISGPRVAYEQVRPLIERWGKTHFYLGTAEEARHMKLLLNLMISVSTGMLGEALTLGRGHGLPWNTMLDVIEASAVASPMVKYKTPTLRTRDFRATSTCATALKDLRMILASGREAGTHMPLAQTMHDLYGGIVAHGHGELDFTAVIKSVEHASGVNNEPYLTRAS